MIIFSYEEEENEMENKCILKVKDLKKYYGSEEALVKALDGVSLEVNRGEFVAIVGTSRKW